MAEKKKEVAIRCSAAEYLTFIASTGENDSSYEMRYQDENIWLTQKMMAALYDVALATINEHIKKIYSDGELTEEATIRKFRIVQNEGNRQVGREVVHYNLQLTATSPRLEITGRNSGPPNLIQTELQATGCAANAFELHTQILSKVSLTY